MSNYSKNHQPLIDFDDDGFSFIKSYRGYNWRGKDCDDLDSNIYPGRKEWDSKLKNIDYNCNGIKGKGDNGKTKKEQLCEGF